MKIRNIHILVAIAAMVLVTLACGGTISTAKITSAIMASDDAGAQETKVFAQDQTFYCIVNTANTPEDTKLKAVWTAVEAEGADPNLELKQAEITAGSNSVFTFNLTNDSLWPLGKYKVDVYLNDKLDRTLEFEVQ
jgi:hypothetical protein